MKLYSDKGNLYKLKKSNEEINFTLFINYYDFYIYIEVKCIFLSPEVSDL